METENVMEKAGTLFGRAYSITGPVSDIDIWLDAAGAEAVLDTFMKNGKVEARYVTVAVNNSLRNIDMLRVTYSSQMLIGSGGYRPDDVQTVFAIMQSGKWDPESIITAEYPLDQLETAIRAAADRSRNLNVVISF